IRAYSVGQNFGREQVATGKSFTYDISPPTYDLTKPANNAHYNDGTGFIDNSLNLISGTSSPDSAKVELCIRNVTSGNNYWDGSSWVNSGADLYFDINAENPARWSYSFSTASWTNGNLHTVKARITDIAGNTNTGESAKYFFIDYQVPSSAITFPIDGVYRELGTISGTLSDSPPLGRIDQVQLYIQRLEDSLYYNGSAWQDTIEWMEVTEFSQTAWSYTLPGGVFTDEYDNSGYDIKVRARDFAKNIDCDDAGISKQEKVTIVWDATPPETSVDFPVESALINDPALTIRGNSTDKHGVDEVRISIKNESTGQWWTGAVWTESEQWVRSSDFPGNFEVFESSWAYSGISFNSGNYNVRVYGIDTVGNTGTPTVGRNFIFDATPPTVNSLTSPLNQGWYDDSLTNFQGTTADDTHGSGVSGLTLKIQDVSAGTVFWNGSGWVNDANENTWAIVSPPHSVWAYPTPSLQDGGIYSITPRVVDFAGNQGTGETVTFYYDTQSPESYITNPDSGASYGRLERVEGYVYDLPSEMDSLDRVEITLYNVSDNQYYTGSTWGTETWLNTEWGDWIEEYSYRNWHYNLPALTGGKNYRIVSRALDAAGNSDSQTSTVNFSINASMPYSLITLPRDNSKVDELPLMRG
ncbi:MAG: hypothetical protein GX837_12515, partial [Methanomicrobiales archaeon]|nr:hypothetical protein [Methanomicrobiales archaeon]